MSDDDRLLSIGSFAVLTDLSIPALRHYDEVGLLKPASIDPFTGYRRYRRDQVRHARSIKALRTVDLPIDEIRDVLAADDEEYVRGLLLDHRERLRERAHVLSQMVDALDDFIEKGVRVPTLTGCRIAELIIGASDLEASRTFYEDVFDFEFCEDKHGDGPVHLHASYGGPGADTFFLFTLSVAVEQRSVFGFLVEDLQTTYKKALAAGAKDVSAPQNIPGMPEIAQIKDPNGNHINLYQDET